MSEINFLPESIGKAHRRRLRIVRESALVAVVAATLVVLGIISKARVARIESQVAAKNVELQEVRDQIAQLALLERQRDRLNHQVGTQKMLSMPVTHAQVIAALSNITPDEFALTRLTLRAPSPEVRSPEAKGTRGNSRGRAPYEVMTIELEGFSPTDVAIANYVGKLSAHPLFQNVKMLFSRSIELHGLGGREFRIDLEVYLDREYRGTGDASQEMAHAH